MRSRRVVKACHVLVSLSAVTSVQPLTCTGTYKAFNPFCSLGRQKGGMQKGTSQNSTCLTPKLLASSDYVHEAPSPRKRAISVTSLFPSPILIQAEGACGRSL